jgi:hypothetical protein
MTHPLQRSPKEKAEKLYNKFFLLSKGSMDENGSFFINTLNRGLAKRCAEIVVMEILHTSPCYPSISNWDECGGNHQDYYETHIEEADIFWRQVLHEIEKL